MAIRTRIPVFWLTGLLLAAGPAVACGALAELIQSGDRDAAFEAIRDGADVNQAQGDGTTPLHWAVYRLDAELVEALLGNGARPDVTNRYGSSPLAEAVKTANVELVEMLLDAGADVEAPNQEGQTALMLSARAGSLEIAELLVRHGADVNARETWRGQTALMWAADTPAPDIVEFLVNHGADVNVQALAHDWSTQITSEPRAQYRPTGGLTPLLYAARSRCTACAAAIVAAGADVNQPNPDGVTPVLVAFDNFSYDTARLLLENGANPNVWDWWGRTPLYAAVDMSSYSGANTGPAIPVITDGTSPRDIVRMLLEAGVDPNPQLNMLRPGRGGNSSRFRDNLLTTGATPLLRAASGHDTETVRALLDHGALVDLPNVMGVTPLMAAAGMGVSRSDRRINFRGDVESRVIATLEVLLAAGADINSRVTDIHSRTARIARRNSMTDREAQTALYGAIRFGWPRVVDYLIEQGAEVDIVDALGRSPLDTALEGIDGRIDEVSDAVVEILRRADNGGA